jgi:hypothetical protein
MLENRDAEATSEFTLSSYFEFTIRGLVFRNDKRDGTQ